MTLSRDNQEELLARIVKFLLPVDGDEVVPPDRESDYWADCELAFQNGLALGVLMPGVARQVMAELISEGAEREHVLFRLVDIAEGRQPLKLSDMDGLTETDLDQGVVDLVEFIREELGA